MQNLSEAEIDDLLKSGDKNIIPDMSSILSSGKPRKKRTSMFDDTNDGMETTNIIDEVLSETPIVEIPVIEQIAQQIPQIVISKPIAEQ